ncbi:MAG TPA: glycosyltransferase family 25 protein [Polyangiaceae bacterium]|nr:glycosyltransferase family 25 protein [Polyangiaceae bacterium]
MTVNDHMLLFLPYYEGGEWAEGRVGGSTLDFTKGYRAFVEQFVVEHGVRSVLDVGCGDWTFSRAIDWKGARYVGLEVLPHLVEQNRARFPGAEFVVGDARRLDEHAGFDLLIMKDVLQHWSNDTILAFLSQPALASFRHILITNCDEERPLNPDIADGDWRPLNLLAPPFEMGGARALARFSTKRIIHRGPRVEARDLLDRFEVWVINLDRRPDRLAHARSQLERVGLRRTMRFQAFDGYRLKLTSSTPDWVRKGAVGCYLSHLALLKQAQARRQPCIVVEDDIVLADDFLQELEAFVREVPEDWDVLLLPGGDDQRPPQVLGAHHARLVATWGTSMAFLRLGAIDRLLEEADGLDRPIDDFYIRMMSSMTFYAPARAIVWQAGSLGTNIGDHG